MLRSFCIVISLLACTITHAQWRTLFQGADMNNGITGMSFYTPSTGYVASNKWVGFSTDSGRTFTKKFVTISNVDFSNYPVNLTFGFDIQGVKAFSADTLLVYGDYAFEPSILRSVNGGQTWKVVFHKDIPINYVYLQNTIGSMVFPGNGSTGIAVHGDEILRTTNRGVSWQVVSFQANRRLHDLSFPDANTGYASGPDRILKTTNGGTSWSPLSNVPYNITATSSPSPQWLFVSANGDHYYSSNAGSSFTKANTTAGQLHPNDMVFTNDSTGYAVAGYNVFQSRNRGKSWELMPGSSSFSYLGYGYGEIVFYNSDQAWALGENEYIAITTNKGGVTRPKALFDYDKSSSCTSNSVQLFNQSQSGYSYRWLRNGVQFATTYNASYTLTSGYDTIKLIVTKGAVSDTMTENIYAPVSGGVITINSVAMKDTVCSNSNVLFQVYNSLPGVEYQVGRTCCGYSSPVMGTGGTITLTGWANSSEDSVGIFLIKAYRYTDCGPSFGSSSHPVRMINSFPVTVALADTICAQNFFNVSIQNSRPGYHYWIDSNLTKVDGTGAMIGVPARKSNATQTYSFDFDGLLTRYTMNVYTRHIRFGCGGSWPITTVNMIGRNTISSFVTNSHEVTTGQALLFKDASKQTNSYVWSFSPTASIAGSTQQQPTGVSFIGAGIQKIQQKTITKEGCLDSANRYIEVFNLQTVPVAANCSSAGNQGVDSIRKRNYFVSRALYEDEFGNRITGGGYTTMLSTNQFYPRGYEGFFAARHNKAGELIWYLESTFGEDYFTYNRNSHIIIEHAIGDRSGNTYLYGHSFNKAKIKDGTNEFPIARAGAFLIKVSMSGKIAWVRSLYNKDNTGLNVYLDYSGGTLLRGRNDEIFVVTHCMAGSIFADFMSDTVKVVPGSATNQTGVIIQYNTDGKIVRSRNFPVQYNNLRRFEIYSSDSYDRFPAATWDSSGKMVIYGLLNTKQMIGNAIDGVTPSFDTGKIKSALLFFDTTNLQVTAIKPIFRESGNTSIGITPESYTVDAAGNYYAGYTLTTWFPKSSQSYQWDSTKKKSFIIAYNANGTIRWKKQLEGLQPLQMLAYPQSLKVYGQNYIGAGFSNGNMLFWSNASPTTTDINKLTIVTDSGSYTGRGRHGLGALDNLVASFDPANGTLSSILHLGTSNEEETGTMRRGIGNQLLATGTINLKIRNTGTFTDTASTLVTYKLPVGTDCNTNYANMPPQLQFTMQRNQLVCTDSMMKISWTSYGVNQVNLSYSTNNGSSYNSIASAHPASPAEYNFNASAVEGRILFKIASGSYSDTLSQLVYRIPQKAYPTGKAAFCPYDTLIYLTGATGSDYKYKWNVGDTTKSIKVQNFYKHPNFYNYAFLPQYTLVTTRFGCSRTEVIVMDSVKHYRDGSIPVLAKNPTGDSLVSSACGLPHVWYKDGVEIVGATGCRIKPPGNGIYEAATRHPASGCTSWRGTVISFTQVITSLAYLPAGAKTIVVMPNPARNTAHLEIQVTQASTLRYEVMDMSGRVLLRSAERKVAAGNATLIPVDLRSLSAGNYLVRMFINGEATYRKLAVVR